MTEAAETGVDDLCFAARALAQTHAMTEASHRYRQQCLEQERRRQHVTELADWAGTALLVGYCVRRSEEQRVPKDRLAAVEAAAGEGEPDGTVSGGTVPGEDATGGAAAGEVDIGRVAAISETLRTGDADRVSLLGAETTVAALDRVIATEVDKRHEHMREQLDDAAWTELEDYIAWWVVHGYSLRASECPRATRVLVVGVGNVLHGDDGFGVEVARRLGERPLAPGVAVAETGIGGIHLVHELMAGYDALVVVDTVDRGRPPGTVMVIDAEVTDAAELPVDERHDLLADMHLATPERALTVARAAGVLPERTIIVGCQPAEIETLGIGLTDQVSRAVDNAVTEIERCVRELASAEGPGP